MNSLIKNLGELAVASRLRMLSEKLLHDVSKIYHEQNLDFEPRWFLIFFQLTLKSPMSITEIADAIGITHPAVNQIAGEMLKAKIIKSFTDKIDKRRRLLSLSREGEKMLSLIKPI
jgi:DNA-binding MarR family transcriptional regulator